MIFTNITAALFVISLSGFCALFFFKSDLPLNSLTSSLHKKFTMSQILFAVIFLVTGGVMIENDTVKTADCERIGKSHFIESGYIKSIGCVMKMNTGEWVEFDEDKAERHRKRVMLRNFKKIKENEYNAAKDHVNENNLFGE